MTQKAYQQKKRIGILGGTFNPIHIGHIRLAQQAQKQENLDEVLFIPTGVSYMKDPREILPARERLEMVRLSLLELAYFSASEIEIKRKGNSYTIDTLHELQAQFPDAELFLITGADTMFSIEYWKDSAGIFAAAKILAAYRPGISFVELKKKSEQLRAVYGADIRLLEMAPVEISSTQIRALRAQGKSISGLVMPAAEAYIQEKRFYCLDKMN